MTKSLESRINRLGAQDDNRKVHLALIIDGPITPESVAEAKRQLEARGERLTPAFAVFEKKCATNEEWLERHAPKDRL